MEHRLEKAKTLLLENTATAQDVGYLVGFKNRSHFSQAFKKRFGYAPSNYLKLSMGCGYIPKYLPHAPMCL